MITQNTLGTILQTIFQLPDGRIVPKQGNWWNPQDITNSGTWIAYIMRRPRPLAVPSVQEVGDGTIYRFVPMMGDLELQFVGPDAEALAQSVSLWTTRSDIHALFDTYHAQIAFSGLGAYEVSNFTQNGLNSILAFNVRLSIQWANMIQVSTTLVDTIQGLTGNVTVS